MQVPFSTFEEVLKRRENRGLAGDLAKAIKAVQPGDGAGLALARCRDLVMQTPVPEELQNALRQAMRDGGIPVPEGEQWNDAMWALKVRGAPALLLLPARLLLRQAAHSPARGQPNAARPCCWQPTDLSRASLPPSLPPPALPLPQSVWASKYNDRAYVSTRKVGINFDDVRMAVLCQRIVPAQVRRVGLACGRLWHSAGGLV